MSHSVERHLEVSPAAYDVQIRRFIPGYEAMLDEVVGALAEHLPDGGARGRVVDLGAGTGALAARIAAAFPGLDLAVLDVDPDMLAQAEARFAALDRRVTRHRGSFAEPLPPADAYVASLALHHVHERDAKRSVYRNIHDALPPGGVLVNADAAVPAVEALRRPMMARWAAHLVAHGDTEAQAYARFAQWAEEDRYFTLDEELDFLRAAGFTQIDVRWRLCANAVFVARRA
jgi:tRNA (cmo5U34)-methyltransferase